MSKITNRLGLPQPFVSAATRDHAYTDKRYSATAVMKGTREAILERRHADEIEEDAADLVWAIFGTAVHSILEGAQETDTQLKENWLSVDMPNGYVLSGIFDLYDDATGTVTDYKTASVWKLQVGDCGDWRKQTLIYVWMLRQIGFDARRGEVVAILKDHSKRKAATDREYPQHPVVRVGFAFSEAEIAGIGRWLAGRFEEIATAELLPDDALPVCTPEERWAKPDKWAVKKRGNKRAVKLHDSEEDTVEHATALGSGYEIEFRPGEDTKCDGYCSVREFCSHWRNQHGE